MKMYYCVDTLEKQEYFIDTMEKLGLTIDYISDWTSKWKWFTFTIEDNRVKLGNKSRHESVCSGLKLLI